MSEEKVEIITLNKEQFKRLREDLIELYKEGYQGLEQYAYRAGWMVKRYLNWLYKGDPSGFFIINVNGELAGFAASHSHWLWAGKLGGEIHEIVIAPEYRRRGLGTKLLKHTIKYLRSKGRKHIRLWVGRENKIAKKLYRKLGFRPVAVYDVWERWVLEDSLPGSTDEQ
ncbi:MAG: N-acetyltransferase [Chloroflexi bacterium]|nr:MAG: N-acetyltransferase [Chloroflexota bacterium]HDN79227.1 GNAT family N-acetyltransferase [Chloroflexota bacterium]